MINVLLPDPVEPINAVVSPGFAVKLIFSNTASLAPGYLNVTLLNSTKPFLLSIKALGSLGSTILGSIEITS